MCGVSGIINLSNNANIKRDHLDKMADSMVHRGPDDRGLYLNPNKKVGLGFRRLSIIDIKNGHQPMSDDAENTWIVFNGEIYNHMILRNELQKKGYKFRTNTDTESILHGYREWGEDIVNRLQGMFAFAVWDEQKSKMFIARDRLGIKPLYYYYNKNRFIFASEIKAFFTLPDLVPVLNEKAMFHYLTLSVSPVPQTMFKGINKLPAGHTLSITRGGKIHKNQYWSPTKVQKYVKNMNSSEIVERLQELLRESIKLRMMSDVPVGVFLSGGLDSSLNVALMKEQIDTRVNTFSVAIQDDPISDERSYARRVSKYYDTNHYEKLISQKDILDAIPEVIYYQDEPLSDPVSIPLNFVSKLARETDTYVIQIGEGSDEIFAGYSLYGMISDFNRKYYKPYSKLPYFLKKYSHTLLKKILPERKLMYLDWALDNKEIFWGGATIFSDQQKQKLLINSSYSDTYSQFISKHYNYYDSIMPNASNIDRIIYLELKHRLPELLLMRVDKMAMASSVETRVPFLDHKLVEFSLNIPSELKYRNKMGKDILKKAARGIVPDFVIERKKTGFCGSARNMVSGEVLDYAEDVITNSYWMKNTFNMNYIKPWFEEHRSLRIDHGMRIYSLMNLAMWQKHWFD